MSKLDFAEPSVSEPQSRTNHHLARQDNTSNPSLTDEDSRVNASAHKTNTYFFDAIFSSFFLHTTNSRSSDHHRGRGIRPGLLHTEAMVRSGLSWILARIVGLSVFWACQLDAALALQVILSIQEMIRVQVNLPSLRPFGQGDVYVVGSPMMRCLSSNFGTLCHPHLEVVTYLHCVLMDKVKLTPASLVRP